MLRELLASLLHRGGPTARPIESEIDPREIGPEVQLSFVSHVNPELAGTLDALWPLLEGPWVRPRMLGSPSAGPHSTTWNRARAEWFLAKSGRVEIEGWEGASRASLRLARIDPTDPAARATAYLAACLLQIQWWGEAREEILAHAGEQLEFACELFLRFRGSWGAIATARRPAGGSLDIASTIPGPGWANFFGTELVSQVGRDALAPSHFDGFRDLGPSGVMFLVNATLTEYDEDLLERRINEVSRAMQADYFTRPTLRAWKPSERFSFGLDGLVDATHPRGVLTLGRPLPDESGGALEGGSPLWCPDSRRPRGLTPRRRAKRPADVEALASTLRKARIPLALEAFGLGLSGAQTWVAALPPGKPAAAWTRLRDTVLPLGYWPILTTLEDAKTTFRELVAEDTNHGFAPPNELIAIAEDELDLDLWLAEARILEPNRWRGREGVPARRKREPMSPHIATTREPLAALFFDSPWFWRIPSWLAYGSWNDYPEPEIHTAWIKRWSERYGAELVAMTRDTVDLRVTRGPSSRDEARALADELDLYCSDLVGQGFETRENLVDHLLVSAWWPFWWD